MTAKSVVPSYQILGWFWSGPIAAEGATWRPAERQSHPGRSGVPDESSIGSAGRFGLVTVKVDAATGCVALMFVAAISTGMSVFSSV